MNKDVIIGNYYCMYCRKGYKPKGFRQSEARLTQNMKIPLPHDCDEKDKVEV